jgi:two-component system, CAI-1 autoinducer sensor kinase/phosphatase CqsS
MVREQRLTKFNIRSIFIKHPVVLWLRQEVCDPEVETILHLSPLRLRWLAIFTLVGHPLFYYAWTVLYPEPYENLVLRLLLAGSGIGFFFHQYLQGHSSIWMRHYFSAIGWLQLPVFITWMYWMNGNDLVWLGTLAATIVIYYQLTDWRLATIGILTGAGFATAIADLQLGHIVTPLGSHTIVLLFAWFSSISLAMSGANLRRERLRHSLVVIGIMAHELRTPLATASLISQAILNEANNNDEKSRVRGLTKLSQRLESLTRGINHHIDLQMINARFMQLPQTKQLISATGLVNKVLTQYPFGSKNEENCVDVIAHEDFLFYGSEHQFVQVLNNLLKNALYSLKVAQSRFAHGDLLIEFGTRASTGRITMTDKGTGIRAAHNTQIFEPFFSTSNDTGHGLGLAYCKQVILASGGQIWVKSEPQVGASFTIELPIINIPIGNNSSHAFSSVPTP